MLIFKNSIYTRQEAKSCQNSPISNISYDELIDPCNLLSVALEEEIEVINFLKRQPTEYWPQDSKKFYTIAHKIGNAILRKTAIRPFFIF